MVHTIIVNNKSYDLPKKTVAIAEKLDAALKIDSLAGVTIKEKFRHLHSFVKEVLGDENAMDILGSDNLNDIDTAELAVIVLKINDAYEKPMREYRTEHIESRLSAIPFKDIASMAGAAQAIQNMQSRN